MKNLTTIFVSFLALLIGVFAYSQDNIYTVLDKNNNDNNLGLQQELSHSLDTLILKSDNQILRVRFISHGQKETITIDVVSKIVRIPLHHFDLGRYTIAVYNGPKIVVLGFNRLLPIDKPEVLDLDLEKSILRASLSLTELNSKGLYAPIKETEAIRNNKENNTSTPLTIVSHSLKEKTTMLVNDEPIKNRELEPLKNIIKETNQKSTKNKSASKIQYSITIKKEVGREMETREEFRQRSVRPNGKKYD